jgi:hypothetical protein
MDPTHPTPFRSKTAFSPTPMRRIIHIGITPYIIPLFCLLGEGLCSKGIALSSQSREFN